MPGESETAVVNGVQLDWRSLGRPDVILAVDIQPIPISVMQRQRRPPPTLSVVLVAADVLLGPTKIYGHLTAAALASQVEWRLSGVRDRTRMAGGPDRWSK